MEKANQNEWYNVKHFEIMKQIYQEHINERLK